MSLNIYPELVKESKVVTVGPDASVLEASQKMTEQGTGAVLVKDGEKLLGIFTERDLLNRVICMEIPPSSIRVADVMTKDPETIHYQADAFKALEMMTGKGYRHLPVVDSNDRVITVISIRNLYKLVKREL